MSHATEGLCDSPPNGWLKPKRAVLLASAAAVIALTLPAAAFAAPERTWVAYYGTNSGTCPQTSPCATFEYAVGQTAAGGEVDAETDGDYGSVVINNSITINGDGHNATVGEPSGQAIAVNEYSTTDVVNLIGLNINGFGTGVEGVYYPGGGTLRIEDSNIYGFTYDGVVNVTNGTSKLEIENTSISGGATGVYVNEDGGQTDIDDNSSIDDSSSYGIEILNSPGQLTVDDSEINENGYGVIDESSSYYGSTAFQVDIDNSTIDSNQYDGVLAQPDGATMGNQVTLQSDQVDQNGCGVVAALGTFSSSNCGAGGTAGAATATISSVGTTISDNIGTGVLSGGAGENLMSSDFVTGNGTGLQTVDGGTIVSLGANNTIYGNTINGAPTSTVSTGAVGPTGATGAKGATGAAGPTGPTGTAGAKGAAGTNGSPGPAATNGTPGAIGPVGLAGTNGTSGAQGPAGEIELVTCTNVKKKVKKSKKTVTQKKCTSKLISSPVKFSASAASATISRAGHIDASGSLHDGKLTLHSSKVLRAGRYTLRLTIGTAKGVHASSQTIAIR